MVDALVTSPRGDQHLDVVVEHVKEPIQGRLQALEDRVGRGAVEAPCERVMPGASARQEIIVKGLQPLQGLADRGVISKISWERLRVEPSRQHTERGRGWAPRRELSNEPRMSDGERCWVVLGVEYQEPLKIRGWSLLEAAVFERREHLTPMGEWIRRQRAGLDDPQRAVRSDDGLNVHTIGSRDIREDALDERAQVGSAGV